MVTQISDWNDLDAAIQGTNGSSNSTDYELTTTLDKDTAGYSGIGDDWEPCGQNATGTLVTGYEGTFDGKGHAIRDLVIKDSGTAGDGGIGLFGGTDNNAIIKNLGVVADINTTNNPEETGILVGFLRDTTVSDCWVAGSIDVNDDRVGGCIGELTNSGCTVSDSYSLASVTGVSNVGGFAGDNNAGTVERSYAAGSVSGDFDVGGFTGTSGGTETDCFYDSDATGQSSTGGSASSLTTADMQGSSASSDLTNFDFSNVWETVEKGSNSDADGYPYLRDLSAHKQSLSQTAQFKPFSITVTGTNSPVNADGTLTVDIDVTNNGSFKGEADIELIIEEA